MVNISCILLIFNDINMPEKVCFTLLSMMYKSVLYFLIKRLRGDNPKLFICS